METTGKNIASQGTVNFEAYHDSNDQHSQTTNKKLANYFEGELEQQRNLSETPTKKLRLSSSGYLEITMIHAKTTTVKPDKEKNIATNKRKIEN
ncbi:8260_t:CDS:2 [Ambispora gerdemannii]|uniref:8260_t:CDS:1 n=1 Tax=Ambispora gerdemannii TaxID=144530 RepID=A0A9N9E284_9GLOM|nr:8260_t:CDS:2 [Ambispora gerdemannii]